MGLWVLGEAGLAATSVSKLPRNPLSLLGSFSELSDPWLSCPAPSSTLLAGLEDFPHPLPPFWCTKSASVPTQHNGSTGRQMLFHLALCLFHSAFHFVPLFSPFFPMCSSQSCREPLSPYPLGEHLAPKFCGPLPPLDTKAPPKLFFRVAHTSSPNPIGLLHRPRARTPGTLARLPTIHGARCPWEPSRSRNCHNAGRCMRPCGPSFLCIARLCWTSPNCPEALSHMTHVLISTLTARCVSRGCL